MNRLMSLILSPAKTVVRMNRQILRTLFFDRVIDRMRRAGPIHDLDVLVKLATRGFWNAITPIQNPHEIRALLSIVKRARPRSILEIGTASGGTLFMLTRVAADDARLLSIDLPGGPGGGGYPAWKIPLFDEFPLPGQRLELIRDNSHDPAVLARVAEFVGDAGLEFLFIDGDHSYEGVKSDFEMYGPLVNPPGLIAFHDIDYIPEVRRFWDEVKIGRRYEEIHSDVGQKFGFGVLHIESSAGPVVS
jgi:predicted O-methyltransferase YrrM